MWAAIHLLFSDETGSVWRTFYSYKFDKKRRRDQILNLNFLKESSRKKSWGHYLSKFKSTIYHEANVSLIVIGYLVLEKVLKYPNCIFTLFKLSPLWKESGSSFKQTPRVFCAKFGWYWQSGSGEEVKSDKLWWWQQRRQQQQQTDFNQKSSLESLAQVS